ncbi:hypothetical protein B0H10DRAFT_2012911 [Mycena sp. CBHHK59/15]|nr:hypothetical protein B0H10DRAFT_2012911 [Mycena sp. CBHHK59/15]
MSSIHGPAQSRAHTKKGGSSDPCAPTLDEWESMNPYGSFVVIDDEGGENVFKFGDTATVLPARMKVGSEIPLHKFWLVKILGIRERNPPRSRVPEIWVKINWYYSPREAARQMGRAFNASHCGKYERIYSDHTEIISSLTFSALVPVMKFREDNPDQKPIENEEIFTRYFLETTKIKFEIKHSLVRLSCSPDTDSNEISIPTSRKRECAGQSLESNRGPLPDLVSARALPGNLLRLAAQPIVRAGMALPALSIAGNTHAVVVARRIVYAAIQKGVATAVPDGWEDTVDMDASIVDGSLPRLELDDTGEPLVLTCPNCEGPI